MYFFLFFTCLSKICIYIYIFNLRHTNLCDHLYDHVSVGLHQVMALLRHGPRQQGANSLECVLRNSSLSVECRVSSVKCRVSSVECRVSSVECRVSSVECRVSSVECRVSSVECQVSSVEYPMSSVEC